MASLALLSACGGGGSGTITGSSGGTSTGGSPTPTPGAGGRATGEIKPTADATYLAATLELTTTAGSTSDLTGQSNGGATNSRSVTLDTPSFRGSFSTASGYSLADSRNSAIFGSGQFTSDSTATDPDHPMVFYTRSSSGAVDYLALYNFKVTTTSSIGSGSVVPRYAGVAGWQHSIADPGARRTRLDYFAYGTATPTSAMPHSGIVKFTLMGSGNHATDTELYFATQFSTVTVDFAAGTVRGILSSTGSNLFNGGSGGLPGADFSGVISGNGLTGPTTSGVAVGSGQFRLLFVGPNADELILTYIGQDGRGHYVGAAVGVRNPYLP